MFQRLIYVVSFVLVLSLIGSASAALPQGWQSEDINTTGGSADESNGTWTVSGDGADIWGTSDAFHFAYVPLEGDGQITARVVDNGTGSNTWAKGGVMIRETLDADSKHMIMALTGGDGSGIAFQGRMTTGGSSTSYHGDVTAEPPYWVRLTREGNTITAYASADGVTWDLFSDTSPDGGHTNPIDVEMADSVYIGLFVTSHAAGEIRTFTFDNVTTELPKIAISPNPLTVLCFSIHG
jgi:regulation of enolase protein 1 (concanavalin A-like superfamily)